MLEGDLESGFASDSHLSINTTSNSYDYQSSLPQWQTPSHTPRENSQSAWTESDMDTDVESNRYLSSSVRSDLSRSDSVASTSYSSEEERWEHVQTPQHGRGESNGPLQHAWGSTTGYTSDCSSPQFQQYQQQHHQSDHEQHEQHALYSARGYHNHNPHPSLPRAVQQSHYNYAPHRDCSRHYEAQSPRKATWEAWGSTARSNGPQQAQVHHHHSQQRQQQQWYSEDKYNQQSTPRSSMQHIHPPVDRTETAETMISLARHGRVDELSQMLEKFRQEQIERDNQGFSGGDTCIGVDERDKFGNTVLTTACQNGLKRVTKLALRLGADINLRNFTSGNSPLHFCFKYGYGDTLGAYLISKGADDTVRNLAGHSCYEVASNAHLNVYVSPSPSPRMQQPIVGNANYFQHQQQRNY